MYSQHFDYVTKIMNQALEAANLDGVLVYSGNAHNYFLDDMPYAFASNPHFRWMVPITDTPYCIIHYQPQQKPILYLSQPIDYWHSQPEVPQGAWTEFFTVKSIASKNDLPNFSNLQNHAWIGQDGSCEYENLAQNPKVYMDYVHYYRAVKTEYELKNIEKANQRALQGHQAAKEAFFQGQSEFEIHLVYMRATQHCEHELPYGNIIALNKNAAVLHYHHMQTQRIEQGQLKSFLIDAGAQFNGYAADITRTYAFEQNDFAELIKTLDKVQKALCQKAVAGTSYIDLHIEYHHSLAQILKDYDIIGCDAETAVASGLTGVFFPHGLGHFIGLQVHDIGGHQGNISGAIKSPPQQHPFLRLTRTLEENHVVTIEPGLYFIDILLEQAQANSNIQPHIHWQRVEEFKPYGGIRIEDNVVIKKDNPINLTRELELSSQ